MAKCGRSETSLKMYLDHDPGSKGKEEEIGPQSFSREFPQGLQDLPLVPIY
jgi:hypothetical protein